MARETLLIEVNEAKTANCSLYQPDVTQFNRSGVNKLVVIKLRHIVSSGRHLMIKVTVFLAAFRLDDAPIDLR